jgi:hypothetical protein
MDEYRVFVAIGQVATGAPPGLRRVYGGRPSGSGSIKNICELIYGAARLPLPVFNDSATVDGGRTLVGFQHCGQGLGEGKDQIVRPLEERESVASSWWVAATCLRAGPIA